MCIYNMLEVCLFYQKLGNYNKVLEQMVWECMVELCESEVCFKVLVELFLDWYWEQDMDGKFIKVFGLVFEMFGIEMDEFVLGIDLQQEGWNIEEWVQLKVNIVVCCLFLDFVYSCCKVDGMIQYLQVSGEFMFDFGSCFIGYCGIGMDVIDWINVVV